MATLTFDTHDLITRLKESGLEEKQAVAITAGIKEIRDTDSELLVTKEHLDSRLSKLKADLLMWLIPILLGQIAVFAAVVKFVIEL